MSDNSAFEMGLPDPGAFQRKASIYRYTPSSGDTVTIPSGVGDVIIVLAPATDLAALTLAWPITPFDGQVIQILCTKNITTLSHSGGTLNRSIASVPATGDMTFVYDLAGTTFMCAGVTLSTVISLPFSGSVAGGAGDCVFYPTDSGLVGGNAIFSSIQSVQAMFDVADPNCAFNKPVVSNSNKTITTNCKKQVFNIISLLSTNLVGSATLGVAPNATALSFLIHGILA